ncbi:MAG TPA: histidinol-phosphate transaminase, partial [Bacteroidales bacterium]|nr:histidinol-phosphate transaminase [Bacteroidales bacterium]
MIDLNNIVRPSILRLNPYSCARDEFKGESGIFLDANENPYGSLNRYPDPYQAKLKSAISEVKGIPVERIFLGNGSDEIIDLCFRAFCTPGVDKALIFPPTYGMYEVSAAINDVDVIKVKLDKDFQINAVTVNKITDKALKLIFICSPNNPTGNSMREEDIISVLSSFEGIVVVDEAYIDFSGKRSLSRLIDKYNNLVVMQTFSKAMGRAAIRVGMAFTSPEIVSLFNKIKPPYNISSINQAAAIEKLKNFSKSREQVERIIKERERLIAKLEKMSFVRKVYQSDSNFILVNVDDANKLYNFLISRNIIVRNRHSIVENCIRIT